MSDREEIDPTGYKLCSVCGRMFEPYRSYQRYCSKECREKAHKKKYEYKKNQTFEVKCAECGTTFETNDGKRKYCSKECYLKHNENHYTPVEKEERTCLVCGATFVSAHWSKRYCSRVCYEEARRMRREGLRLDA